MYLDSHAHLEKQHFGEEVDAVIERARQAGLKAILAVGNGSLKNNAYRESLQLAEQYDFIFSSLGVHPHEAADCNEAFLKELEQLGAQCRKVVAWGEVGLDYHYDFSPRNIQRRVFEEQLAVAGKLDMPLIIHSRLAEEDTLTALRPWVGSGLRGVLHCFTGSGEFARKALDMGMYLSFSGILTFKKAQDLREIASWIPADRWLVETDCPYLAPLPHRGCRNEPSWVCPTTHLLAEIRRSNLRDLQLQHIHNFNTLFGVNISLD